MHRSIDRILTTHAGALQRPLELATAMVEDGENSPTARAQLGSAVAEVVRQQAHAGVDVVNDGEFGKSLWMWYVRDRLGGIGSRDWSATEERLLTGRDREEFADFYAWADEHQVLFGQMEDPGFFSASGTQPVVTAAITYQPEAVRRDAENLRAALAGQDVTEAFLPVVAPASIEVGLDNEYYSTRDELMRALADAMHEEYKAIIDAGFLLQVDDAWVPAQWDRRAELDLDSYRRYAQESIDVLNHALDGLPEDRIRYHICWGSWHGPHKNDVPLADIVDIVLQVRAGAYLIEAANPRHEHEYHLWEDVQLPEGKILVPGVVSHGTNIIEHPELVAERIGRFAERVGRENVIAGTDCGLGGRVHPQLGWAKLAALVEGARLASERLW